MRTQEAHFGPGEAPVGSGVGREWGSGGRHRRGRPLRGLRHRPRLRNSSLPPDPRRPPSSGDGGRWRESCPGSREVGGDCAAEMEGAGGRVVLVLGRWEVIDIMIGT